MGASDAESAAVLSVRGLERHFGERTVLDGIDLDLTAGDRLALRGSNGSGKTTLMRCILGSLSPSAGSVAVCGHAAGTTHARASIGAALSQERSFYLRISGRDNLLFFARLRLGGREAAEQAVDALVDELELADIAARRVDRCSTGMTQQLGVARALIGDPPLLLLDEPTRSLDDGAIQRLWAALDRRRDAAVIIATHRPEDADRCERQLALGV